MRRSRSLIEGLKSPIALLADDRFRHKRHKIAQVIFFRAVFV